MKRKPLSIILQGDVVEAQKHIPFARSKAPVARKYKNASGASSFKKRYTRRGADIIVQSLNGATTIFINAEALLDVYIQDDTSYYQLSDPTRIYYTTNVWQVKSFPKSPTGRVKVEKIITLDKEPGLWNDEQTNAEVWMDVYPKKKLDIKYPHYYYTPTGDSRYTPASTWIDGDLVSTTTDFRFYDINKNITTFPTSHTYGFKYQPVDTRGYARYFDGANHRYPIVFTELNDHYDPTIPLEPRGIMPFVIGQNGYQQWWSGLPNFHVVGIHESGDMYYTASRYDGSTVQYILQTFDLNNSPDIPEEVETRVSIISSHPSSFSESDHYYKDPVEIICTVLKGDASGVYGYVTCQIESSTVWDETSNVSSVRDGFIKIHLGTSWDNMTEVVQWSGSFFHVLAGDHMTEVYNFTSISPTLLYAQATTREWTGSTVIPHNVVIVIEKINDVWTVTPMGSFSTVEPLDKEWAVIPSTSYAQCYNFKTETYHDIYERDQQVLIGSNTNGSITTTPLYKAVKKVK
jgi:hypothetical protein